MGDRRKVLLDIVVNDQPIQVPTGAEVSRVKIRVGLKEKDKPTEQVLELELRVKGNPGTPPVGSDRPTG